MVRLGGKTAFVFTGGGSLGAVQVGMLRVLLAFGVQPDFVVGASVGAINASYFAGAPNAAGIAALERIWSGLRRADIFPFTLVNALGLIRHPGNVVNPSGLRRVIETNLPYTQIGDAQNSSPYHGDQSTRLRYTPLQRAGGRSDSGKHRDPRHLSARAYRRRRIIIPTHDR